jgi:hypothetical protein
MSLFKPYKHKVMTKKIKIELSPYNALEILKFCREFINDENKGVPGLKGIHEAIGEYERQVYVNISEEQLEDAINTNNLLKPFGVQETDLKQWK